MFTPILSRMGKTDGQTCKQTDRQTGYIRNAAY